MSRKRIYVAGPLTKGGLAENVNRATAAFVALAKAGFAPMCPHWSVYSKSCGEWTENSVKCIGTALGNDQMSHADWMGVDLPWVAVSDAVLRLPGESAGADLETAHAAEHGVPVLHSVEAVVAWFAAKGAV